MDSGDILLLGIAAYFYFEYAGTGALRYPSGSSVPVPPGSSLYPPNVGAGGGVVTSPLVIPSQSAINQQVSNINTDISAVAGIGTAVVGTLASLSVISAAVAGPIGAAIAAVALLVKNLISDTHYYANQLVQRYENPFGQGVIQIITAVNNEFNNGTLTLTDAQGARDAVVIAWQNYQDAMHNIQTQGSDWYIVATQSLNNLDNQYLGVTLPNGKTLGAGEGGAYGDTPNYGFMSSWIDWLNQRVTELGGS